MSLAKEGCSTCACNGCSKEDLQVGKINPPVEEDHNESYDAKLSDYGDLSPSELDKLRNGCCRECMKAFSANGKVYFLFFKKIRPVFVKFHRV